MTANIPATNSELFEIKLSDEFNPHMAQFTLSIQTDYGHSFELELELFIGQGDMLLVDDDEGENYEIYFIDALEELEITPNHWDVNFRGDIPESMPMAYSTIIWFTGNAEENTLSMENRNTLQAYLSKGGNLFLSGQNIGTDIGNTNFYSVYLKSEFIQDSYPGHELQGVDNYPEWEGTMISINGIGGANNQDSPGIIHPINNASKVFFFPPDDEYNSAVCYDGDYKLVYFEFGFEAVNANNPAYLTRDQLMERILDYFDFTVGAKESGEDLSKVESIKSIKVSPNPANKFLNISFELICYGTVNIHLLKLDGSTGMEIYDSYLNAGTHHHKWTVDKKIDKGLYLLQIQTGNQSYVKKIFINK